MHQGHSLDVHELAVRPRQVRGWVQFETGFRVFGLKGDWNVAAAAFCRPLFFDEVTRFVGRDPIKPGLEGTVPMKALDIPNHGEEGLLADFIHVLERKMGRELKYEFPGDRIKAVEQLVPRLGVSSPAQVDQFAFALLDHDWEILTDLKRAVDFVLRVEITSFQNDPFTGVIEDDGCASEHAHTDMAGEWFVDGRTIQKKV